MRKNALAMSIATLVGGMGFVGATPLPAPYPPPRGINKSNMPRIVRVSFRAPADRELRVTGDQFWFEELPRTADGLRHFRAEHEAIKRDLEAATFDARMFAALDPTEAAP